MDKKSKIYVAGHTGLVGSAIVRRLQRDGYTNLLLRTHRELDLTNQSAVEEFFDSELPEYVFLAAAKVGGILANSRYSGQFLYENLMIESNVIECARRYSIKKLLFLGSSCIYPRLSKQPIFEEELLTGPLEPTNEAYAIAKIAGIKLCHHFNRQYGTNFISVMPTNLYGINDNFDPETSHVLPALIKKIHHAKEIGSHFVPLWGTGKPLREFLHADDLAEAVVFLMESYNAEDIGEFINVGSGLEISIRRLAELIADIVGFNGAIEFDHENPDGTPRKLLDITKLKSTGWEPKIDLEAGIKEVYQWALENEVLS